MDRPHRRISVVAQIPGGSVIRNPIIFALGLYFLAPLTNAGQAAAVADGAKWVLVAFQLLGMLLVACSIEQSSE